MSKSSFQKSDIPSFEGNSGNLSVIEFKNLPFEVKRIFYITKVPEGFERGFHAHKETQQFLVCLRGSCDVYLEFKEESETIKLEKNSEGILIGKEWHIMKNFSDDQLNTYLSKIPDEVLYAYNVYQIEGEGRSLFSSIEGDEDTIMGLPVKKIKEYLSSL